VKLPLLAMRSLESVGLTSGVCGCHVATQSRNHHGVLPVRVNVLQRSACLERLETVFLTTSTPADCMRRAASDRAILPKRSRIAFPIQFFTEKRPRVWRRLFSFMRDSGSLRRVALLRAWSRQRSADGTKSDFPARIAQTLAFRQARESLAGSNVGLDPPVWVC
jgi:hypothetical protein